MVKINKLEIENVKRVKAVKIEPSPSGLTIIGGNNGQGKTSVLDTIAWALGGNKYKPSQAMREGSMIPPNIHITLSNGLVVERKGKNSDLKVTDPNGQKAGQTLLDSFVEELAIDLPKFMNSTSKEKANILLQIVGVGPQLYELERQENEVYQERLTIGRIAEQKKKFAAEQQYYPDAPKDLISITDLIQQQQSILAKNGENQRKREQLANLERQYQYQAQEVERLKQMLAAAENQLVQIAHDVEIAKTSALDLKDQSTAELEQNIAEIDEINRKVRANADKEKAEMDANEHINQYNALTAKVEAIRKQKSDLLANANLPLPGLSVQDNELIYNGQQWDNMSGAEQLRVSTAIVRKLKPDCGFILLDKLEQMDMKTLNEFGQWLEQEGLQAIATRVSTGEECSIIIEDGYVVNQNNQQQVPAAPTQWQPGQF